MIPTYDRLHVFEEIHPLLFKMIYFLLSTRFMLNCSIKILNDVKRNIHILNNILLKYLNITRLIPINIYFRYTSKRHKYCFILNNVTRFYITHIPFFCFIGQIKKYCYLFAIYNTDKIFRPLMTIYLVFTCASFTRPNTSL